MAADRNKDVVRRFITEVLSGGRLDRMLVLEGATVRRGELIAELNSEEHHAALDEERGRLAGPQWNSQGVGRLQPRGGSTEAVVVALAEGQDLGHELGGLAGGLLPAPSAFLVLVTTAVGYALGVGTSFQPGVFVALLVGTALVAALVALAAASPALVRALGQDPAASIRRAAGEVPGFVEQVDAAGLGLLVMMHRRSAALGGIPTTVALL